MTRITLSEICERYKSKGITISLRNKTDSQVEADIKADPDSDIGEDWLKIGVDELVRNRIKLRKVHPGKTLQDELYARQLNLKDLKIFGLEQGRLEDYVAGKTVLTDDELHLVTDKLNVSFSFFKNLQENYLRK